MRAAVRYNGGALEHAELRFKEVVLEAVQSNGDALEYASAELQEVAEEEGWLKWGTLPYL